MEYVANILSGYSCSIHIRGQKAHLRWHTTSRNFDSSSDPRPAPVPPPSEWRIWNPWSASVSSACLRTTSWRSGALSEGMAGCGDRNAYQDGVHKFRPYMPSKHIREHNRNSLLTLSVDWRAIRSMNIDIRSDWAEHSQPFAQLFPAPDCPAM